MLTTSIPIRPQLFELSGPAPELERIVTFECLAGTPDAYFITIPADSDPLLIQQLENRFCDGFASDRQGFLAWLAAEATLPRALIASVALLKDPVLEVRKAAAALLVNFPDFQAAPAILEAWVPNNRPETPRESRLHKPARDALDSLRFHAACAVKEIAEETLDRELQALFPALLSVDADINPFEARRAFKWVFAANQNSAVTALKLESIAETLGPRGAALSFLLECARLSIVDDNFTESSIFFPFRDPASRFIALWRAAPRYRSLLAAEFS